MEKDPQTHAIIGAAMEVHRELGCGFLEAVYQEALEIEFRHKGIPNEREVRLTLKYKMEQLSTFYKPDFICYGEIVVELKAVSEMAGAHAAQVINALKATGHKRGLLINFGKSSLEFKRYVL